MSVDSVPVSVATPGRAEKSWGWIGLFVVALITFVLVRIAVLNIFYNTGDMQDPGWLAFLTWHNDWRLHGPAAYPELYFSEHVMPILWLTNAISYLVPLGKYDYYAACIALIHALYAAGVYRAWFLTETHLTPARVIVAILVALAAAFSAVAIAALGLPHPELAIPALALWFVIAMARRAYVAAACWLVACLAIREDAGMHVFALLILWAGVLAIRRRDLSTDIKFLLGFAILALIYSVLAFLAKHFYFPASNNLIRSYLGDPPFHHVTVPFILHRLQFYVLERGYVLLPLLVTLVWAAISRNPLLPLGYISALPWLLLSTVAVHVTVGTLSYYYGFPFWLSLAWPLVALRVWPDSGGRVTRRWPYALLLLVSLVGWQSNRVVIYPLNTNSLGASPFVYNETLRDRAMYQKFVDYFVANRPLFGSVALDGAVFGLMIDHADRPDLIYLWPAGRQPETMIYFPGAYDWRPSVLPLLRTGIYRCVYAVPGTRIRMATQYPISDDLPHPIPLMVITSFPGTGC
jgi:hypothetical protein